MNKELDAHQQIQEKEYTFPYHHLVSFTPFATGRALYWGLEYYAYLMRVLHELTQFTWQSLLEVGCGDGKFIKEAVAAFPDHKITGIDYSERAILFAKAFNYENGAELSCGDVAELKQTFDVVVLIETLEHIPDGEISGFVRALSARLIPQGTLIVTVPTINTPLHKKHYRHYDIGLLNRQLAGFSLSKAYYVAKKGWVQRILFSLATRGSGSRMLQSIAHQLATWFFFEATERTYECASGSGVQEKMLDAN